MDLYSLIKFLRVSPFDELKFWKHEVDNKTASGRKRMTSIVNSLLLRRTKDQTDAKTGKPLVRNTFFTNDPNNKTTAIFVEIMCQK